MKDVRMCVIGLGYVGLPLAVEFSKHFKLVGFDVKSSRIEELRRGVDRTLEVDNAALKEANIVYTNSIGEIAECNVYVVTVPTPINQYKQPDLSPLISASKSVGQVLKKGDVVVYESTVYPGCTEEDCVPILEQHSGLKFNVDFFCGYSPERMNPGDRERTVAKIVKVTSGSTPEIADFVDKLYAKIVTAGTHKASSIRVAEAAKIIENSQRDINIAFVNELAILFHRMGLDTREVLDAAGTKWNFLRFTPGLVGGHCIGVDPYYLTFKAESLGYHPEVILSGRRINDSMGMYVANQTIKLMIKRGCKIDGSKVLVLGLAFKENCPDVRNSRVVDIVHELNSFGCKVDIYDPWTDAEEVKHEYGLQMSEMKDLDLKVFDAVIVAVGHSQFKEMNLRQMTKNNAVIFDLKSLFDKSQSDGRL